MLLHTNLQVNQTENITGTVSDITVNWDKFVQSKVITGYFNISGNISDIGAGLASTAISGTLGSRTQSWYDGSKTSFLGLSISVSGSTDINSSTLLANPANYPGDDSISVSLQKRAGR